MTHISHPHWAFGHRHQSSGHTYHPLRGHSLHSESNTWNPLRNHSVNLRDGLQSNHSIFSSQEYQEFLSKHYAFSILLIVAISSVVLAGCFFVLCRLFRRMEALNSYWTKDANFSSDQLFGTSLTPQQSV